MRFQQLKRRSNAILKKKLYKSGKNWVIKSSLSFAGGLMIFGATQVVNVKAETTDPTQTTQENSDNTNSQIQPASASQTTDTDSTATTDRQVVNTDSNNEKNVDNSVVTPTTDNAQKSSGVANSQSNVQTNQSVQVTTPQNNTRSVAQASAQAPVPTQTNTNQVQQASSADPDDIPYDTHSLGPEVKYYIDDSRTLHVTAGDISESTYHMYSETGAVNTSPFNIGVSRDYDKVVFDGEVTLHGDASNFFMGVPATSIENIEKLDTSDVTNFNNFFSDSSLKSVDLSKLDMSHATTVRNIFNGCADLTDVKMKDDSGKTVDTSKVTDFYGMFWGALALKNLDVSGLDTSSATTMVDMFSGDQSLQKLDVSNFNTSHVTNMSSMFNNFGSDVGKVDIIGLENWDVSNVKSMDNMFDGVNFSPAGLSTWDTSNVISMMTMFQNSKIEGELDLSNFTGDSLQSISGMFNGASLITKINLKNLKSTMMNDTHNNQYYISDSIKEAFANCTALTSVDLSSFSGSKIKSFNNLFHYDKALTTIIWPNIDTDSATDLSSMFSWDTSMTTDSFKFLDRFKTSKVTDFSGMFNNCQNMTSLDLSNWDASAALDFSTMFSECDSLTDLKLPKFENKSASDYLNMNNMISDCNNLSKLDLTNFVVPIDANRSAMLRNSDNIKTLVLNSKSNLNGTELSYSDIYKGWSNVGTGTVDDPEADILNQDNDSLFKGSDMMALYNNDKGPSETWVIVERKLVPYVVKYEDYDTDADLGDTYDISGTGREGLSFDIETLAQQNLSLPGYDTGTIYYNGSPYSGSVKATFPAYSDETAKTPTVYIVKVKKIEPFKIIISDVKDPIELEVNDPDAIAENTVLSSLDNVKQLDPDKTTIDIGIGTLYSETDLYNLINQSYQTNYSPSKTVKGLVFDIINILGGGNGKVVTQSVTLPINVVYAANQNTGGSSTGSTTGTTDYRTVRSVAQTIATFSDGPAIQVYDYNGNEVFGKTLDPNSDWKNDQIMTLNGQTYYRVSTDEWIKSDDAYVYVEHISKVRVYKDEVAQLEDVHMKVDGKLPVSTDWKTDRYVIFNGQKYYRVSTDEFVPVNKVYEYQDTNQIVHSERATQLYDERGNSVGHTLNPDTDYKTDRIIHIGQVTYYRVSTDEFVREDSVLFR
ncbi:BspA family leucine-rich repeat surface protein [Companilactobacillus kedongensis]|uniref:BspA family leucine-rich repeat surface protein n=1 Tax=Companilactobacillus kedongensis TaxID=2486004 RepID=UPI001CDBCA66|nr:BspA family leucine-rich repeat surface protein [Companilactobacillus kedongensis]